LGQGGGGRIYKKGEKGVTLLTYLERGEEPGKSKLAVAGHLGRKSRGQKKINPFKTKGNQGKVSGKNSGRKGKRESQSTRVARGWKEG